MAVTGRQKTYVYFASQQPIAASAMARLSEASRRALLENEKCSLSAREFAIWFQ
jgi:hypothetical protein